MDDYRDIHSYKHVTVVLKLTYTGKLQTLNLEPNNACIILFGGGMNV